MLNLDANGFTRVTNQFSLTLPSPTMISVILLELEYHLTYMYLADFPCILNVSQVDGKVGWQNKNEA